MKQFNVDFSNDGMAWTKDGLKRIYNGEEDEEGAFEKNLICSFISSSFALLPLFFWLGFTSLFYILFIM